MAYGFAGPEEALFQWSGQEEVWSWVWPVHRDMQINVASNHNDK